VLPVHNIPVVHLNLDLSGDIDTDTIAAGFAKSAALMDLDPGARLALAFTFAGTPDYPRLVAMARAIMRFAAPAGRRDELLVLMIDGDIGRGLGRLLKEELHLDGKIVSIDGVQLRELDYVDIGTLLDPPGVVPVVIKSLLFS
jgi:ethanolamine utilization protein EutA